MVNCHYRLLAAALISAASAVLVPAVAAGASAGSQAALGTAPVLRVNHPAPAGMKPRMVGVVPPMEPNPAAYAARKAAANAAAARRAGLRSPVTSSTSLVPPPAIVRNWPGQQDTVGAPSDSTGAIGTTRYIELVNSRIGIYSRTSKIPTARGPLLDLTGCATSACTDDVFDPQIIWDPATNRFFYATDDVVSSSEYYLNIGFSTSATPTLSAGSWCRYSLRMAPAFPDYPKLGDTKDFILVGTNEFTSYSPVSEPASYIGSQIAWVAKPPSGSACPAASTFKLGFTGTLKNADGTDAFTPVPGDQTDSGSTGWVTAIPASIPLGGAKSANFLTLFKVTKSSTGAAMIPTTGSSVPVRAYSVPASAPQPGTPFTLDTSDARPTQAVLAVDPAHGGVTALWTQHTVFGGAGAQVRWYEINPATHSLIQHGTISSSSRFTFDGAISPDRRVNGTSSMFGGDMVIDVVQSSPGVLPTIKVASKIGTGPISALTPVATSTAPDTGKDCYDNNLGVCRWGDYAAATPDPAAPTTGTTGEVWGSSMLAFPGGTKTSYAWATRNFAIKPLDNDWNTAIEVPGTAALNTGGNAEISSVSCTSPGSCTAGGEYTDSSGHEQAFAVSQVNGTWDSAQEVPGTAALNTGGSAGISEVSCTSPGNCTAGGDYTGRGGDEVFVVSQANGTWGTAEEIPGITALNTGHLANVNAVSCASAGNCSVGGWYNDSSQNTQAFIVSQANGTWGTAEEVPGTAALNTDGQAIVNSVSCTSPGNCSAAGFYTGTLSGSVGFVISQVNGTWGTAEEDPGNETDAETVSCVSAGNCVAGGSYWDGSKSQASIITQVNGTWGPPQEVPGIAALNTRDARVTSVSCTSAGNCSADGWYDAGANTELFAVSEVNGTWDTAVELPGAGFPGGGHSIDTPVISCVSAGQCAAGGSYEDSSGHWQAFVASQVNQTWQTPEEVPGTAALNTGGFAEINSVSCSATGGCSAGGFYTDSSGHWQAFVVN